MARVYRGEAVRPRSPARLARAAHLSTFGRRSATRNVLARVHRRRAPVQLPGLAVVYAMLRLQDVLPLNPQHFAANSPDSAFNTAVSFATNTNWQSYGGETTMSYLSQMLGLTRAELRLGGVRHGGAGRADPRLGPALHSDHRQLLVRPGPQHALHPAAAVARPGPGSGVAGRHSELQAVRHGDARSADELAPTASRSAEANDCRWDRPLRRSRSSNSAPTAAASSTSTRPIRSRIRRRSRTFLEMLAILRDLRRRSATRSA